jgi:hypothetical protein
VNNRSVPSTHAERKNTNLSDEHSFTPHPSLSPYSQTELLRDKYTCYAWAGGTFFQLCCCVSFLVVVEIVLGDNLPTIPVVLLCLFFWRREIVFDCTGQFFGCGWK